MNWQTTYPSLATVQEAGASTLDVWLEKLPLAQTDVERTIRRRIQVRLDALVAVEIRQKAPDLADKINDAFAKCEAILGTGVTRGRRF